MHVEKARAAAPAGIDDWFWHTVTERDVRECWPSCHVYTCRHCGLEFALLMRRDRGLHAVCPHCGGQYTTEWELGKLVPIVIDKGKSGEGNLETLVWEKNDGWYQVRIESLRVCVEVTPGGKRRGSGSRKYAHEVEEAIRQYRMIRQTMPGRRRLVEQ